MPDTIGGILNTVNGPRRVGTHAPWPLNDPKRGPLRHGNAGEIEGRPEDTCLSIQERALLKRIQLLEMQVTALRKLIRPRRCRGRR